MPKRRHEITVKLPEHEHDPTDLARAVEAEFEMRRLERVADELAEMLRAIPVAFKDAVRKPPDA